MLKGLNTVSGALDRLIRWILIFCFTVMTVTYFGQIVLRYVFQTGFHWTEELTRYTNIAMVMLGSAYMAGKNRHINVSALESAVSPRMKKYLVIVQQIITGTFFSIVIFIAFDMIALAGSQVSTNMRIPMRFVYSIFPIAFSILVFQVIVFIINQLAAKEDDSE